MGPAGVCAGVGGTAGSRIEGWIAADTVVTDDEMGSIKYAR